MRLFLRLFIVFQQQQQVTSYITPQATRIVASSEENLADVESFVRARLMSMRHFSQLGAGSSKIASLLARQAFGRAHSATHEACLLVCRSWYILSGGVISTICDKSGGNFLYARMILQEFATSHFKDGRILTRWDLRNVPLEVDQIYSGLVL